MATIDVGSNSQITVTFPQNLIFKGSAKSYNKQGIAIVNPKTGEVTLEKLTSNISVKKIRFAVFQCSAYLSAKTFSILSFINTY